jgi:hypothetical protein
MMNPELHNTTPGINPARIKPFEGRWVIYNNKRSSLISSTAGQILFILMNKSPCSYYYILDTYWQDPNQIPDFWYNFLCQQITILRKTLKPFNWIIDNERGFGLRLKHISEERTKYAKRRSNRED